MAGENYGDMVARLRNERGWTQTDLARTSGVARRTLQNVEQGKVQPTRRIRLAINATLGIEGDAAAERSSWPRNVKLFLDQMGAYLMTIEDEEARMDLMVDLTTKAYRGELRGPNG